MRALKLDRARVEEWCENLRIRFQAGPVPILEWAQPAMVGILAAVYGRSIIRRAAASLCVASVCTSIVFSSFYLTHARSSSMLAQRKIQMERDADPTLYRYATDPDLRAEYEKAWEHRIVRYSRDDVDIVFIHDDGIYKELRSRQLNYQDRLAQMLLADPDSAALTPLFLLEGNYMRPGFQWMEAIPVFFFNVLLDIVSVTILFVFLERMKSNLSLASAIKVIYPDSRRQCAMCSSRLFELSLLFSWRRGLFLGTSRTVAAFIYRDDAWFDGCNWIPRLTIQQETDLRCFGCNYLWRYHRARWCKRLKLIVDCLAPPNFGNLAVA